MKKISLTIGNFDGVHRGHQALLKAATAQSQELQVLTFHPHPAEILAPERAPVRLFDYKAQKQLLRSFGAKSVEAIEFNKDLAKLTGREFFSREILSRNPAFVVVGHDFRFGHQRKDGLLELTQYCQEKGISVHGVDPLIEEGRPISSTWIRECLHQGNLDKAASLLGHRYQFSGQVVEGKKLGRTLGFPTANLRLAPERKSRLPLTFGVYAGREKKWGRFVMNVGNAPSVHQDQTLKVEVHFLDISEDLYGQELQIEPQKFIRQEMKFANLELLKKQISLDINEAKQFLGRGS